MHTRQTAEAEVGERSFHPKLEWAAGRGIYCSQTPAGGWDEELPSKAQRKMRLVWRAVRAERVDLPDRWRTSAPRVRRPWYARQVSKARAPLPWRLSREGSACGRHDHVVPGVLALPSLAAYPRQAHSSRLWCLREVRDYPAPGGASPHVPPPRLGEDARSPHALSLVPSADQRQPQRVLGEPSPQECRVIPSPSPGSRGT